MFSDEDYDDDEEDDVEIGGQVDGTMEMKEAATTASGQKQVTIGDKKFYVVSKDGNKVTLSLTPRESTPNTSNHKIVNKIEGLKGL